MKKFAVLLLVFSFSLLALPGNVLAATLSLSPSSGTFNRSCNVSLAVVVDTQGAKTDGTDAIIFFDPTRVTGQSITNGDIYPDFPGNNIDSTAGKITISGLASVATPFLGKGTLATINFTVPDTAPVGATQIKFEFDPYNKAKTTDSNVVQQDTVADVLSSVTDGNYIIGTGNCAGQAGASPSPSPGSGWRGGPVVVVVATPAAAPKTIDCAVDKTCKGPGTPQLTATVAIFAGILTVLGILGLALL